MRGSILAVALLAGMAVAPHAKAGECVDVPHTDDIPYFAWCAQMQEFYRTDLQDWDCQDLWLLRNGIFHEEQYCFSSARGKAAFSNRDCRYREASKVPLNATQKQNVALIKSIEVAKQCR